MKRSVRINDSEKSSFHSCSCVRGVLGYSSELFNMLHFPTTEVFWWLNGMRIIN